VALIPAEVDPAMERRWRKRIEIGFLAGRCEHHHSLSVAHDTGKSPDGLSRGESVNQRNARPFAVARHRVVDAEVSEQRFGRDAERRSSRDDFRPRRYAAQSLENGTRLRSVMAKRDGVAVVDVANRDADYVGIEPARCFG
jgi:hypothetical protein